MKLNMEQKRIIELEPSGHMLVKGVAGSGKTTVSVKRIPHLLRHYCSEPGDNVLLVTFNKTLLNYIKYQYNKVEDEGQMEFESLMNKDKEIEISTIDSLMFKYFIQYKKRNKANYKISDKYSEFQAIGQAIESVSKDYEGIKILSPKNSSFLIDEINWIKSCNIVDLDTYQNIDRIGRMNGVGNTPQKLLKNSDTRAAIFELMNCYDKILLHKGFVDFKTMNIMAYEQAQLYPQKKFKHIIIDESQDLTRVQLEFLKAIYSEKKYSSIMFVADNTQSIYSHSWLGKGRPFTTIGFDMSGKSRILTKNYRTTTQISSAAYNLIEQDDAIKNNVDFVKPSLIDRQGSPPIYKYFKDQQNQLSFILSEIEELRNDYNLSDICIVAREIRLIENIESGLNSSNVPCEILNQNEPDFDSDKIKLVTMHSIKGLEFKVIFLVNLDENIIPNTKLYNSDDTSQIDSEERKLLYVGMTRANELLYMSTVGKPSKFIKEIDNADLRIKRDCSLRPFQSIAIPDYKLTNQIYDLNSKEELIRQWIIRELIEVYGYPLDLLILEYPVQNFSSTGYVDIAVNIFFNNELRPYLFVETKKFGYGIESGLEQLKSYMEANKDVRYGIITDGLEILIINRNQEVIQDIPKCQPNFLPEKKETKVYFNLKNNRNYSYSFEKEDNESIDICELDSELSIEYSDSIKIPIAGDVAAGAPILVNNEYHQFFTIPKEWIISPNDTFALRVTGDSMSGIGIEKGSHVIVHRQNTASNGDIVIAIIEQEATMKKFMLMGDTVLLISENPNYEPIQMKIEDVMINGKVIGYFK
ncbi:SOS regulatory protein LexA [Acetoanaerobium pronyense]|uniref:DNA 3'-5' helicase n=1 Tax=Acetoanaerobium pronyense TaxID=1482736 RepID=A0ABS4KLW8_9FIRM|nr:transcriptional repressor LexA [Acetoanaerobium pronyense]MBP2028768.1 SOS regulatory protein LexA [Acetoanaerobium pronyense]